MLTPEQLQLRRSGIGSSDIGAIAGLPSHRTQIQIWLSKVQGVEDDRDDLTAEVGNAMEAGVLQLYASRTRANVTPNSWTFIEGGEENPRRPRRLATPDATACRDGEIGTVEVKTALWEGEDWGDGDDAVPDAYVAQCTWEMGVTDRKTWCDVPALFGGGRKFRIYRVPWDAELWAALCAKGDAWWEKYVVGETPPPPDASESYTDYLNRKWKETQAKTLKAEEPLAQLMARLVRARRLRDIAQSEVDVLTQLVKEQMGSFETVVSEEHKMTWKSSNGGTRTFRVSR